MLIAFLIIIIIFCFVINGSFQKQNKEYYNNQLAPNVVIANRELKRSIKLNHLLQSVQRYG
jgi:hypothetical protein